jgi:glycosyltransferase involved in cell wall biosynthesis
MRTHICLIALMPDEHVGVIEKMRKYAKIVSGENVDCNVVFIRERGLRYQVAALSKAIVAEGAGIYLIRFPGPMRLAALLPVITYMRFRGAKFYIEIPTPLSTVVQEVAMFVGSVRSLFHACSIYAAPLIIRAAADRVLQYGNETAYFRLLLESRTRILANPFVETESRPSITSRRHGEIRLVNCSYLHDWHGIDRLLKGVAAYVRDATDGGTRGAASISVDIIGDGPIRKKLIDMADELEIGAHVVFHGQLDRKSATQVISNANIGVGTLGSHRVGLRVASPLKHREYVVNGLPFIMDIDDPDFDPDCQYVYRVTGDESPVDLRDVIDWYGRLLEANEGSPEVLASAMASTDIISRNERRIKDALLPAKR